jgi:hypothetical protein
MAKGEEMTPTPEGIISTSTGPVPAVEEVVPDLVPVEEEIDETQA